MPDIKEFDCPSCGGNLQFDIKTQEVKCPFCGATYDKAFLAQFDEDLQRKHVDETNQEEAKAGFSDEEVKGMSVYTCDSCGGQIITGVNTSSTICPYCNSAVLVKSKISGDLKPDIIIPFKLTKEDSSEAFKKYFKKKFFIPGAFKKENQIEKQNPLYVPYWIFGADAAGEANFKGDIVRTWSDGDYRYKEVSHYRLWRSGSIAFDNIPVDGSRKMPDDLMESIEPFDANHHEAFLSGYLSGYSAERYDVSLSECEKRANTRMREGTVNALASTIGARYENVSVTGSDIETFNEWSKYALYPIWLLNVKWKENTYSFAVNGDTGIVAGKYPVSKGRVALTVILALIGGFGLGFLFGWLFCEGDLGLAAIVGGILGVVVAAIYGTILSKKLKKRISLKQGASDYTRPGSFKLTGSKDIFISKSVTSQKISKS